MGGRLSLVDCLRLGSGLGVPGAEGDGLWGSMGVGAPVSRSGLPGLCWEPNDSWRLVRFRLGEPADTPVGVCGDAGIGGAVSGGGGAVSGGDSYCPVDGPLAVGVDVMGGSCGMTGSIVAEGDLLEPRSQSIVRRLAGGCTGTYFRRNLRLRSVMRLDPSTRIAYWSYYRTSITTPVLSHFSGCGPV